MITDSVNFLEPILTAGVEAQAGDDTAEMKSRKKPKRFKKVFRSDSFPDQ
jgi:hypothetical protein